MVADASTTAPLGIIEAYKVQSMVILCSLLPSLASILIITAHLFPPDLDLFL